MSRETRLSFFIDAKCSPSQASKTPSFLTIFNDLAKANTQRPPFPQRLPWLPSELK